MAPTVRPPTDIPRPGISNIADICTPHQGCRYPRSWLPPEPPPGKTSGSRRAFPAFRWPAPDRQAESEQPSEEATRDRGSCPDQALRPVTAVDQLSFDVRPGVVTGFLGPNGSGKSTTMRLILGLDAADHGTVRVAGHVYHDLRFPLREVGALLEAKAFHPGRSAKARLQALAASNAIAPGRVDETLHIVGLQAAAT